MWACSGTTSYWKGSWAVINWKCPPFFDPQVCFWGFAHNNLNMVHINQHQAFTEEWKGNFPMKFPTCKVTRWSQDSGLHRKFLKNFPLRFPMKIALLGFQVYLDDFCDSVWTSQDADRLNILMQLYLSKPYKFSIQAQFHQHNYDLAAYLSLLSFLCWL